MSTTTPSIKQSTHQPTVTHFHGPRIDDLYFGVDKIEDAGITCYYITVTPQHGGVAHATVKSAGSSIGSDDEAIRFLERLEELKSVLKLSSF